MYFTWIVVLLGLAIHCSVSPTEGSLCLLNDICKNTYTKPAITPNLPSLKVA